jgi:hypothetical protein
MALEMSYSPDMFHQDQHEIVAKMPKPKLKPDSEEEETPSNFTIDDIMNIFIGKYGKSRGVDYCTRFLSVLQFINHYRGDLILKRLVKTEKVGSMEVHNELLNTLLGSFKTPQPPNPLASSPLLNQYHDFNYNKVMKVIKLPEK